MAAGFFLFKSLNLSVFRKGNQAAFAALGMVRGADESGIVGRADKPAQVGADPSTLLRDPDYLRSAGLGLFAWTFLFALRAFILTSIFPAGLQGL